MKKKNANHRSMWNTLKKKLEFETVMFVFILIAFPIAIYAKGIQKDTAEEIDMNKVYGIVTVDETAEEARTYEPTTEEETTVFQTPVEDLGEPATAEYEEQEIVSFSSNFYLSKDESEGTEVSDDEFTLLCRMVRIEMGEGSGEEYYTACYLQAATALNRLSQGWASTLTEVLMQYGQYYGWGYDTYDWENVNINIPDLQQAVLDCMTCNDTPENLVFADSRHNHEGTDTMDFYMEVYGQDFYLAK